MERPRTVFVCVAAVLFLTAVQETEQVPVGPLEVRLVGGASQREGRLEVRRPFSTWGTVCDDGFDNTDASVVCKALGFGDSGKWVRSKNSNYGEGTGPIWLSDVTCSGNETNLGQCPSQPWGQNNCGHKEDVEVVCRGGLEIRLAGGPSEREGRLEVRKPNRMWGTVCDDGWTAAAASVVCRQLDLGEVGETVEVTPYGQGTGPVWLRGVNCTGREVDLSLCPSQPWGENRCRHTEDVAIVCRWSAGSTASTASTASTVSRASTVSTVPTVSWVSTGSTVSTASTVSTVPTVSSISTGSTESTVSTASTVSTVPTVSSVSTGSTVSTVSTVSTASTVSTVPTVSSVSTGSIESTVSTASTVSTVPTVSWVSTGSTVSSAVEVRLVGGRSVREGRLEVRRYNGVWGTVCDDFFSNTDASVVCRQLQLSNSGQVVPVTPYGQGSGSILLDDVNCLGNETNLVQCSSLPWGQHNCGHHEDVGIVCNNYLEVRLVGGRSVSEGRLEVRRYNGVWGTVCDDSFSNTDASVVCRQLQLSNSGQVVPVTPYGQGSGSILLDDVNCLGNETNLVQCSSLPWGQHNCGHHEDVGIVCNNYLEVRLVGGRSVSEGRLEVRRYNGVWGTVCDDSFSNTDASVVCRQLQLSNSGQVVPVTPYGQGSGSILLDDVNCLGNETNLVQCSSLPWGQHNCGHHEDVGIVCNNYLEVRLVGGRSVSEGRLEVRRYNGVWGTVCDDSFSNTDASVVCRQLQLSNSGQVVPVTPYGQGSGSILLDDVNCLGNETNLVQCSSLPWGQHNCGHHEDVGIVCNNYLEVRLVGGRSVSEGRLEVRRYNGVWGTVCDDSFSNTDASVVCRQLQLSNSGQVVPVTPYGQGSGSILLDDVNCLGNETNLVQCSSLPWGQHNCGHHEDVGIVCNNYLEVRLVGGRSVREGRLEVRRYNGVWGTVCDDSFSNTDASVVCRQLQLSNSGQVVPVTPYGQGSGSILLDDVNCLGNETNLAQCSSLPWGQHNCGHHEDVGIVCYNYLEVRLVGGRSMREGRLEVRRSNGVWGTVCDDSFSNTDASVVCRQLQFSNLGQVVPVTPYGQGTGSIWLDDVNCRGTETNLGQCLSLLWGQHNCVHSEDVGIVCNISTL